MRITGVDEKRVSVVPHGCRSVKLPEGLKVKDELPENYILFIGTRNRYKNFYFFVSVLAKVMEKDRSLHLVCTGKEFSHSEKAFLASLGIERSRAPLFCYKR